MYKTDYLMRVVEEISKMIATILALKKEQSKEKALKVIEETLDAYYQLSGKDLADLSEEQLNILLEEKAPGSLLKAEHLADLMILLADCWNEPEKEEARKKLFSKALFILEKVQVLDKQTFNLSRKNKISEIRRRLQD